jgi:hypothetical protein
MYYWKEYLSFTCQATSNSDVLTIVAGIRFLATMTFPYCCKHEHAYRAVAWQRFGQIRYNIFSCLLTHIHGKIFRIFKFSWNIVTDLTKP